MVPRILVSSGLWATLLYYRLRETASAQMMETPQTISNTVYPVENDTLMSIRSGAEYVIADGH
jgi:hypothetical protein